MAEIVVQCSHGFVPLFRTIAETIDFAGVQVEREIRATKKAFALTFP